MRLLFITQAIDIEDPVLSFAHSWVRELSQHFESIEVIALKCGAYSLPSNVRVFSLGKEEGHSRLKYVTRFFSYLWRLRSRYDVVLVHQNQEYVLLAGWLWEILGKRVYLWRNHYVGTPLTTLAAFFCKKTFCTSEYSYTASLSKNVLMPVGVDTSFFTPDLENQQKNTLLFLGRIAPSKRIEVIIEALALLKEMGITLSVEIYGNALPHHRHYLEELYRRTRERALEAQVHFHAGVRNDAAPRIFASHEFFVNCSQSGMYDKTIFESLATGALTLAASKDYAQIVDSRLTFDGTAEGLARALKQIFELPEDIKNRLKSEGRKVAEGQSLSNLAQRLKEEMST